MQLRANIAEEINQHHEIAIARADEAIHHASQAGKLLLEVKAALPHGQFLAWVQQHVRVSVRQAQRYMAVAEGKPAPIRALGSKSDTVSHLPKPEEVDRNPITPGSRVPKDVQDWFDSPAFCPTPGHWYWTTSDKLGALWLVPSLEHPEHFHISRFYDAPGHEQQQADADPEGWDGRSLYDGTKRPVPAWMVESYLQTVFGVEDPLSLKWEHALKPGLSRPFGEPERR
jgi:hypothetical protein